MTGVVKSPGLMTGRQVMRQQEPGLSGLLGPIELIKHFPGEPFATSRFTSSAVTVPARPISPSKPAVTAQLVCRSVWSP